MNFRTADLNGLTEPTAKKRTDPSLQTPPHHEHRNKPTTHITRQAYVQCARRRFTGQWELQLRPGSESALHESAPALAP